MKSAVLIILNIIITLTILWGIYKTIILKIFESIGYYSYESPIMTTIFIIIVCSILKYIIRKN